MARAGELGRQVFADEGAMEMDAVKLEIGVVRTLGNGDSRPGAVWTLIGVTSGAVTGAKVTEALLRVVANIDVCEEIVAVSETAVLTSGRPKPTGISTR